MYTNKQYGMFWTESTEFTSHVINKIMFSCYLSIPFNFIAFDISGYLWDAVYKETEDSA